MKNKMVAASLAALTLSTASLAGAECEKGFREVTASGSVNTTSLPPAGEMQAGQIELTLTATKGGHEVFSKQGAVMGEITGIDISEFPIEVTLNHKIGFAPGFEINTTGDQASVFGNPFGCSVPVVEVLSDYTGTKIFKNATGAIVATGFINVPDDQGRCINNEFELSGTLCIEK